MKRRRPNIISEYGKEAKRIDSNKIMYKMGNVKSKKYVVLENNRRKIISENEKGSWINKNSWSISPRGRYLLYAMTEEDGHATYSSDIYVSDLLTNENVNLTNTPSILESYPEISFDGKYVLYKGDVNGQDEYIYILELNVPLQ